MYNEWMESIFLFRRTNIQRLAKVAKEGFQPKDPQNPTEQIIEYYREKKYPNKPSRLNSIFFVTTLSTFFKTDIGYFGELAIILAIRFTPEILKFF